MANVCERCKRSMSSHDDHASCPQCRMAAGDCSLDFEESLQFLWGVYFQTVGETEKVLGGCQGESQPARETALVCSLPSTRSVDLIETSISLRLRAYFRNLFPGW